ncbi:MAG: asparagine synthase (glutamine-hydrolyzing) [Bacteroidales bacterium]|nr:asparagine synthase (glutamine-hydrolyzing) [Bacteroidales bacterium]
MCGIAGILNFRNGPVSPNSIEWMLSQIQHRGPDESGIYIGEGIGLGNVRLSIIDLATGQQPMTTPEEDMWIVYNGEIFNYIELRDELRNLGYKLRTSSDTEVLLLLYRHYREKCLEKLNGQFAVAIWDSNKKELFLARDRVGIRPLFYSLKGDSFVFGSEIKSIFASGLVNPELHPDGLNQVFTFWSALSPNTIFKNIFEVPPGHYMKISASNGIREPKSYWHLQFKNGKGIPSNPPAEIPDNVVSLKDRQRKFQETLDQFESLLRDAIRLRLRSDVQVAAYLSGGIDSSATTYYIKQIEPGVLNTFSIGFDDAEFDETLFQQMVSSQLDTNHEAITCYRKDIGENFRKVLWHTEIPLLRTGAVPMYLLSGNVHKNKVKVVITGEGADELLGGYNIFKEALIREFWAREPESKVRPLLFGKLYPYLQQFQGKNKQLLKFFYGFKLTDTGNPLYSHQIRWHNAQQVKKYFTREFAESIQSDPVEALMNRLPVGFESLDLLSRAQWIEINQFLSSYLLSSQGDRMSMANSVEGRYPFLDHRVIEFCASLPADYKIKGLNEKYLLKKLMTDKLPSEVVRRPKQAYRAPVANGLLSEGPGGFMEEMLSPGQIQPAGIFQPDLVEKLLARLKESTLPTENENMALAGILSTQILLDLFMNGHNPFPEKKLHSPCRITYDKKIAHEKQTLLQKHPPHR